MIHWRYYCVSEVLMDLRLVCVIMPRSRCLLSSLWKPSVAGSPFKSSRGYGSSSLRPLRNGHDRGPPPQSQTSPTPVRLTYVPASTFQQARLRARVWYANRSFHVQACAMGPRTSTWSWLWGFWSARPHLNLYLANHCLICMHISFSLHMI